MATLEPIDPEHAVELYLTEKDPEYAPTTLQSHRTRLTKFAEWCDLQGIDNLNDLVGRLFHDYQLWRREEGDLAPSTEKSQMDTLRVFVRWLGSIDGVEPDLHVTVESPTLPPTTRPATCCSTARPPTSGWTTSRSTTTGGRRARRWSSGGGFSTISD